MQVMKDKINRAIKHYNYGEDTSSYDDRFMQRYNHFTDKDTLKNWSHTIYGVLSGLPNSTHIKAKNCCSKEVMNVGNILKEQPYFVLTDILTINGLII